MKLRDVKEILEAEVVAGDHLLDREVQSAGGADLMSDVLSFARPGALLLTGLTNPQVIRTAEVWEVMNAGPMPMPHPVHIHGLQFRVLDRSGSPADLKEGYVDSGWKDTVLLMPGERARLLLRFEDFSGLYLYHCHNLEHEDLGMMRNYRVIG